MKKNKHLYRCYVGGYFLWAFGCILAPLLMVRVSLAFALVVLIIACLSLAAMITSHVFYNTKREAYPIPSFISHGVNYALILTAFITEMVYTAQGKLGLYAVIMGSICLFFYTIDIIFLVRENRAVMKATKAKAERLAAYEASKQ